MNYQNVSKEEVLAEFTELKKNYEALLEENKNASGVDSLLLKDPSKVNNDSVFLASLSYKLAENPGKDAIKEIALPSIKEYTKAGYAQFSVYDPERKALILQQLDFQSELMRTLVKIAGKGILSTASPVSESDYQIILKNIIKHSHSLCEISFGGISESLGKKIERITGFSHFIAIAHINNGILYGTTLLAFKNDQELPAEAMINSYANILAVALRNKITEKALNESEANLKAIAENTVESIWSIDKNYNILYVNQVFKKAYNETFGVQLSNGDNILDALPAPLRTVWKKRYDRALGNEQIIVQDKIDSPNGAIFIEVAMNPITIGEKVVGVSVFGKNNTAQRNNELMLLQAMDRNKALLNANPDLMFLFNSDHEIVDYNASSEEADLYAKPEFFLGKKINEVLPEDISRQTIANIDQVLQAGQLVYYTYKLFINGKDQHYEARYVQCGSNEVLAIIRNISRQKEDERNLRSNEANLEAILENALESIWSIDLNYNIQYVNKVFATSFQETFGVLLEKGVNILEALPPALQKIWKPRYDRAFKNEHFEFTDRIDHEDNSIYIEVAIIPIVVDGEVVGASLFGKDITQSKQAELQLIAAKEKAEESDRLKSAFLANMSHEIRTPMNGILGFSELLKEPGLKGDQQLEFIEIIQKSGNRMLNIINDLVNISKIESGQAKLIIAPTNLNNQMEFMKSFFATEAKQKGLELTKHCPLTDTETNINSDKEKIYAILSNLIKNAIKFTEKGHVEIGYELDKGIFLFYVKDTGIGIPRNQLDTIFDRFVQADSRLSRGYEGSGLGLSISKAYVEMLGGKIWVESEEGIGSAFYFTIPAKPMAEENEKTKIQDNDRIEANILSTKILIAEDDEISTLYLKSLFTGSTYKMLFAENGLDAVNLCKEHKDIGLVLMDIKMPEMDGQTAAQVIKSFRPELPIIAQTAFALDYEKTKFKVYFDDYITKPIKSELLKQKIEDQLNKKT